MKQIFKFGILSALVVGIIPTAECMWRNDPDLEEGFSKFIFQERVKELCIEVEYDPNPKPFENLQYISKYNELLSLFEKEKQNLKPLEIEVIQDRLTSIQEILNISK